MKTRRVMTRDVVCVTPGTRLSRVVAWMDELQVRHIPVVQEGQLVGIISDRDVLLHTAPRPDGRHEIEARLAGEVMTPNPITCLPDQPISHVAELMLEHRIDSIPVVNPTHRLVGLVTTADLIELLTSPPDEAFDRMKDPLPFSWSLRSGEEHLAG